MSATMTAAMTGTRTSNAEAPTPAWARRALRSANAHTEFLATLVAELQGSVQRLQVASATPDAGAHDQLYRETKDIARLVELLDAIDGPRAGRRLTVLNLPELVLGAAGQVDAAVEISGQPGNDHFVADGAAVQTAAELLILALAGDGAGGPVQIHILNDYTVGLEGTIDLTDARRSWQLRSSRRVLEAQGFRLNLSEEKGRYRVQLRVGR
jgi:hypothetical protein